MYYIVIAASVLGYCVGFESAAHSIVTRATRVTCNPPCKNGAMCKMNEVTNQPFCECLNLFIGVDCSGIEIQVHNPCLNGGHCKIGIEPCKCQCTGEWTGDRCQNINHCYWDRCNGGTCIDGESIHKCEACPPSQSGYNCQIMEKCTPNPCMNEGICTQTGSDSFECTCKAGFLGDTCQHQDLCTSNTCGHGTCNMDANGGYLCTCELGYLLPDCTTFSFCQTELHSCVNGDCHEDESGYYCDCNPGWIGPHCATQNPCVPNPCLNSGSCLHDGSVAYCMCAGGFAGDRCEIEDLCNPSQGEQPCKNGASCSQTGSTYTCNCLPGSSGTTCEELYEICLFETEVDSKCPLQQDSNDHFDWTRRTGPSGTSGTGPTRTIEGLYYMLADASEFSTPTNKNAKLVGQLNIASGSRRCIKFKYNMNGLYVKKLHITRGTSTVWSAEKSKGPNWHTGAVNIDGSSSPVEVKFVATLGKGAQSDIAIDNIQFLPQPCGPCDDDLNQPCYLNNQCMQQEDQTFTCNCRAGFEGQHCEIVDVPLECDFEDSTQCFLEQTAEDNFDWTLNSQPLTPSGGTGPTRPTDGIHYMYIEASGKKSGDYAILKSPTLKAGDWCLSWKYSMYGRDIGRLSILVKPADNSVTENEVWFMEGNIGNRNWHPDSITVSSPQAGQDFIIGIKGTRPGGYKGDMAIDDVRLAKGACTNDG